MCPSFCEIMKRSIDCGFHSMKRKRSTVELLNFCGKTIGLKPGTKFSTKPVIQEKIRNIVPTPTLVGREELYTQLGFLFRHFWPIDMLIVESFEWYH